MGGTPGSDTYGSMEPTEGLTRETKPSESAVPPSVIHGEDWPEGQKLDSLEPSSMEVPGPDAEVAVRGHNFTEASVINWNGGDEPTEFVSESELRTLVRPSTVQAPLPFSLPVYVRTGGLHSSALTFTFIAGEEPEDATLRRNRER